MLEKAEADEFIKRHEDKFRHVLDDPNWVRVKDSQWLRYRVIDGVPVGVVVSLYQLQYAAYPINCEDLQRLLRGRLASKVDVIVIVFMKSRRDHIGTVEAGAFHDQSLVNKPTISGKHGDFWSLTEFEVEGKESPL